MNNFIRLILPVAGIAAAAVSQAQATTNQDYSTAIQGVGTHLTGVISSNIGAILAVFAIAFAPRFVMTMFRRAAKG